MARKPDLDPGDEVEYAVTVGFSPDKETNVWLKAGGTTTVREGENGSQAFNRLANFHERKLEERINAWYEEPDEK